MHTSVSSYISMEDYLTGHQTHCCCCNGVYLKEQVEICPVMDYLAARERGNSSMRCQTTQGAGSADESRWADAVLEKQRKAVSGRKPRLAGDVTTWLNSSSAPCPLHACLLCSFCTQSPGWMNTCQGWRLLFDDKHMRSCQRFYRSLGSLSNSNFIQWKGPTDAVLYLYRQEVIWERLPWLRQSIEDEVSALFKRRSTTWILLKGAAISLESC